jgi:hypothetical protein
MTVRASDVLSSVFQLSMFAVAAFGLAAGVVVLR